MPLCKCGVKVDRLQSNLQCQSCEKIFHSKCLNINVEDVEFIDKKAFKCKACLSARRSSLSSNVQLLLSDNSNNDTDKPVSASVIDGIGVVSSKESTKTIACLSLLNISQVPENLIAGRSVLTLEQIFDELIALKKTNASVVTTNESLLVLVSSLREQNVMLETKVSNMQRSIDNLSESLKLLVHDSLPMLNKKQSNLNNNFSNSRLVLPGGFTSKKNALIPSYASTVVSGDSENLQEVVNLTNDTQEARNKNDKRPENVVANAGSVVKTVGELPDWELVRSKNKKSSTTIIGLNDNCELGVVAKKKWVHLSSFKNNVSVDEVMDYVAKHTEVNKNQFECFKLVKKDAKVEDLKFVNFKLGVTSCYYGKLFDAALWPANIKVRPFRFLVRVGEPTQGPTQGPTKAPNLEIIA